MRITIVYDNGRSKGLKSGWGLSCLIEDDKRILFDCGDNGDALAYNMKEMGIDASSIDMIVLSHDHWDHTGGLQKALELAGRTIVAIPKSFSHKTKSLMTGKAEIMEIEGMRQLSENVYTTGELESPSGPGEQSLIIKTSRGTFILTGCSHPGLEAIINKSRKFGKIYGIMGGFHGFSDLSILKGISVISPCHCTEHAAEIRDMYPEEYVEVRTGSVIEL